MNLGFPEMFFIFLLALILFGPKKLPEIGRQLGKALSEFKRASNEFKYQLESEMRQIDTEAGSAATGSDNSLASGIGRAVTEFQRVSGEVRARLEGGMRQLEVDSTDTPTPPVAPIAAEQPAPPEPGVPAKGADA